MLLAKALPDELAHGYKGRLLRLNVLNNTDRLLKSLREHFHKAGSECKDFPLAPLLASSSNLGVAEFVRAHTLLPFQRAVTSIKPKLAHGDPADLVVIRNSAFRLSKSGAFLCPECVAEDKQFWGFAYWRRIHQLPGIDWCPKHSCSLMWSPSENELEWQPNPKNAKGIDLPTDAGDHPIIQRFTEIIFDMLDRECPLSCFEASSKLSLRAQSMGIRIAKTGSSPNLSDLALQMAPRAWLTRWFPGFNKKRQGAYFPAIDRAVRQTGTPFASAFALALLFESADEALDYWRNQSDEIAAAPRVQKRVGSDFWNSKDIHTLYTTHLGNAHQVASSLRIPIVSAHRALQEAGLPALGNFSYETTGKALLAFFNGASLENACSKYGAEPKKCERILRTASARFASALKRMMKNDSNKRRSAKVFSSIAKLRSSKKPTSAPSKGVAVS